MTRPALPPPSTRTCCCGSIASWGADIDLDSFDHRSIWNADNRRIEMHLVSRIDQSVTIAGKRFHFPAGESIHTENSHKFTTDSFAALIEGTGWHMAKSWTSDVQPFGVFQLAAMPSVDHTHEGGALRQEHVAAEK